MDKTVLNTHSFKEAEIEHVEYCVSVIKDNSNSSRKDALQTYINNIEGLLTRKPQFSIDTSIAKMLLEKEQTLTEIINNDPDNILDISGDLITYTLTLTPDGLTENIEVLEVLKETPKQYRVNKPNYSSFTLIRKDDLGYVQTGVRSIGLAGRAEAKVTCLRKDLEELKPKVEALLDKLFEAYLDTARIEYKNAIAMKEKMEAKYGH